ncbi:hypothetical protein MBANPS3_010046 [Mucor bainieri]
MVNSVIQAESPSQDATTTSAVDAASAQAQVPTTDEFEVKYAASPRPPKKRNIDKVAADEIEALFNATQNSPEGEDMGPVHLRDKPSADLRPPSQHYIVNANINISKKFHGYQCQSKQVMETHGFVIETSPYG